MSSEKAGVGSTSIPKLTYGSGTNFTVWREKIETHLTATIGRLASFIHTLRPCPYIVDTIDTSAWPPADVAAFQFGKIQQRMKEHADMQAQYNRAFGIVLQHVSPQSLERLKLEPDWAEAHGRFLC